LRHSAETCTPKLSLLQPNPGLTLQPLGLSSSQH
jgi:hypothetical protein